MTRVAKSLKIVLAVVVSAATGCAPHDGELAGDVFIVTKGGENYKLGLVTVRAIPAEVLQPHIDQKKQHARLEVAKLAPEVQRLQAAFAAAKSESDRVYQIYLKDIFNDQKEKVHNGARDKATALESELDLMNGLVANFSSGEYYLDGLPPAITSAKTDADGKFTLKLPRKGRFALAALGSREVGRSKEAYVWLVWASLDGQPSKRVMLSNDNLWGEASDQSVVTPGDLAGGVPRAGPPSSDAGLDKSAPKSAEAEGGKVPATLATMPKSKAGASFSTPRSGFSAPVEVQEATDLKAGTPQSAPLVGVPEESEPGETLAGGVRGDSADGGRVVRIGGQIAQPKLIRQVKPVYPDLAVQSRVSALVILEAEVDTRGHVKAVKILRGHPLFDDAAMEAVKQWRYEPLLLNGEPTGFILTVTVNFRP